MKGKQTLFYLLCCTLTQDCLSVALDEKSDILLIAFTFDQDFAGGFAAIRAHALMRV